ncbi:MAG: NADH-quinone oxidoreductase subunit N [Caldilineales bacterium]|nr:NADH-quinone oxidoreductase subunit N [Caldilineales bacterium]
MNLPALDFAVILPELIVAITALVILIAEIGTRAALGKGRTNHLAALLALVGLLAAGGATLVTLGQPAADFGGMVRADDLSRYLNLIVIAAGILGILLAWEYLGRVSTMQSEYYALLLIAITGMMFLAKSVELITLFVSLELLSVSLYVLTGFDRKQLASSEASFKYFLLGAFASGFVLYGAALFYADTGSTKLADIAALGTGGFFLVAGLALLLVGFGFKLALVPFHMWTPDAYQGAPTPVTAFMSVATKAAAFVALFRVLQSAITVPYELWAPALAVLSLLTMTVGNLAALRQTSLKRMLAFSSIAHAGYMLMGLVAGTADGLQALLFYLVVYAFMNMGAFAIASMLEPGAPNGVQDASIASANGLYRRRPLAAAAMAIFMLSLAGIPPLAGFFGKLYLFNAAVQSGWVWLAVAGVINSAISAYYYLRVTVAMFMAEPAPDAAAADAPARSRLAASSAVAVAIAVIATLVFGLFTGPWLFYASQAIAAAP